MDSIPHPNCRECLAVLASREYRWTMNVNLMFASEISTEILIELAITKCYVSDPTARRGAFASCGRSSADTRPVSRTSLKFGLGRRLTALDKWTW